jgi:hypothetical protein
MKAPRISTWIIGAQSIAIFICLIFGSLQLHHNYLLEITGTTFAQEVGFSRARTDFVYGRRWLCGLKPYALDTASLPTDGATESTGRRDGPYEIQGLFVCKDYGADTIAVWKAMVDAYNPHMHQFYEKPEWFDKNGFRVVRPKNNSTGSEVQIK